MGRARTVLLLSKGRIIRVRQRNRKLLINRRNLFYLKKISKTQLMAL